MGIRAQIQIDWESRKHVVEKRKGKTKVGLTVPDATRKHTTENKEIENAIRYTEARG